MEVTALITGLSTLGPALGSVAISAVMVYWLIKRDTEATTRQDRKDTEYLKTLASLQETSKANAELILKMSENVRANTEVTEKNSQTISKMGKLLNRLTCLKN